MLARYGASAAAARARAAHQRHGLVGPGSDTAVITPVASCYGSFGFAPRAAATR